MAWLRSEDADLMLARATAPILAEEQAVLFYLYVDDVATKHAELRDAGPRAGGDHVRVLRPRGEFRVFDPDGYSVFITPCGTG